MLASIESHSTTISNNAHPGERMPKKIIDHNTFNASCKPNTYVAARLSFTGSPLCEKTMYADKPISKNKMPHTGPNTHDGGVSDDLLSVSYHGEILGAVKIEPTAPVASESPTHTISK